MAVAFLTLGLMPPPGQAAMPTEGAVLPDQVLLRLNEISPELAQMLQAPPVDDGPDAMAHIPARDFDGDGGIDILALAYELEGGQFDFNSVLTLTAYSGATGRRLWVSTHASNQGAAFPYLARLGRGAAPGIIVVTWEGIFSSPVVTMEGIDRRGDEIWKHEFRPTLPQALVAEPLWGFFDLNADGARDVLFGFNEQPYIWLNDPVSTEFGILQPYAIDGGDGSLQELPREVVVGGQAFVAPMGDLDGVQGDDYIASTSSPVGDDTLRGKSGVDGHLIWESDPISDARTLRITNLGDLTGDGADDVALTRWPSEFGGDMSLHLMDGADGTLLWTRRGPSPYLSPIDMGNIDRDLAGEIVYSYPMFRPRSVGMRIVALDGNGSQNYDRTHEVPANPRGAGSTGRFGLLPSDLDGDGVVDLGWDLTYPDATTSDVVTLRFFASGRTGRPLAVRPELTPLGSAIEGHGDDLQQSVTASTGRLVVHTYRGEDGSPLWTSKIASRADTLAAAFVRGGNLDGDDCADVIVTLYGRTSWFLVALSGRDGLPLWGRTVYGRGRLQASSTIHRSFAC